MKTSGLLDPSHHLEDADIVQFSNQNLRQAFPANLGARGPRAWRELRVASRPLGPVFHGLYV